MAKVTRKVSKKIGLSKSKVNYRKHERRLISRHERRLSKIEVQEATNSNQEGE